MQFFDSAALLATLFLLCVLFSTRLGRPSLTSLLILLGICLTGHLLLEGFRWQMVPAYVAILFIIVCGGLRLRQSGAPQVHTGVFRFARYFGAGVAVLLLALTALISYAFPVFDIPKPRGQHLVGTTEMHLIDDTRLEKYTKDPTDYRELMVRIWYPAAASEGFERDTYWRQARKRSEAVTRSTPLPWFTFTHLGLIPTNSYWQAPIARSEKTYPVVFYSHGIGIGWASANTVLAEGLASQGYVVIGIEHAFIGSISIFPNGHAVTFDEATSTAMNQPPPQDVRDMQERFRATKDWQEQIEMYTEAMSMIPGLAEVTTALDVQVADQRFVLNQLEMLQNKQTNALGAHLDLTKVGIVGMSLGGSAAVENSSSDQRFKAGVNLDGFHPRHIDLALETTPFLFVNRDDNLLYNTNYQSSNATVYSALVSGVTHFNFFDFAIMSPLYQRLGILGPLDGERGLVLIQDHIVAFFDRHLRDSPGASVAQVADRYDEVVFTQRNAEAEPEALTPSI